MKAAPLSDVRDRHDRPLDQGGGEVRRAVRVGDAGEPRRPAAEPADSRAQGGDVGPRRRRSPLRRMGRRSPPRSASPSSFLTPRRAGRSRRCATTPAGQRRRVRVRRQDARRLRWPRRAVRVRDGVGPRRETSRRHDLRGHADAILAADLASDGKTLATGGYDRMVKLWDIAAGREIADAEGAHRRRPRRRLPARRGPRRQRRGRPHGQGLGGRHGQAAREPRRLDGRSLLHRFRALGGSPLRRGRRSIDPRVEVEGAGGIARQVGLRPRCARPPHGDRRGWEDAGLDRRGQGRQDLGSP